MRRCALIAFCTAALSIVVAAPLRADQCSELVDEYNAGRQRLDDFNRQDAEKAKDMILGTPKPSREELRAHLCVGSRFRLLAMQRELEVVKRFFPQCAGHLPPLPSGKACDVACHARFVTSAEEWFGKDCGFAAPVPP
jgi:hypothetical protein